jgi:ABC-type sugar transport system ATPase subunit
LERALRAAISEVAEPPALALKAICKRFGPVVALDDANLTVRRGEVHALIGQNGAGKSTMINLASGMLQPDVGEIRVAGGAVDLDSTRDALRLGIATVYQELSLLPNLTIAQNLALGREPRRLGFLDVSATREHARAAMVRMGLQFPIETPVGALTLAERQLVEIAKALSHNPSVLILDEPTAALASREVTRLFDILRRLRDDGIATLYVSHRLAEVLDLCDRATVLRNGRTVLTTDLADLSEANLTEAMVGGRTELFRRGRSEVFGAVVLECANLRCGDAVNGVSFEARQGEILGLTGLLGAGASTVARLVGGDLHLDAGTIRVRGVPVQMRDPRDGVAAGLCLVTDERKREGILPNLALKDNVALPSLSRRRFAGLFVDATAERSAVLDSIRSFGVGASSIDAPMRTLSGGNQQKALISRWRLAASNVYVLIEPTRGVDVAARADIYRRIDELTAVGAAIIVVTSDIPELLALADRIIVMRDGAIFAETRPADVDEERLSLMIQGAS